MRDAARAHAEADGEAQEDERGRHEHGRHEAGQDDEGDVILPGRPSFEEVAEGDEPHQGADEVAGRRVEGGSEQLDDRPERERVDGDELSGRDPEGIGGVLFEAEQRDEDEREEQRRRFRRNVGRRSPPPCHRPPERTGRTSLSRRES